MNSDFRVFLCQVENIDSGIWVGPVLIPKLLKKYLSNYFILERFFWWVLCLESGTTLLLDMNSDFRVFLCQVGNIDSRIWMGLVLILKLLKNYLINHFMLERFFWCVLCLEQSLVRACYWTWTLISGVFLCLVGNICSGIWAQFSFLNFWKSTLTRHVFDNDFKVFHITLTVGGFVLLMEISTLCALLWLRENIKQNKF